MSVLKIRDENGKIHSIASLKGDKGDGVPEGGVPGQVIKMGEDGTEWGDVATNSVILENTEDISSVVSCDITQRGLYEVSVYVLPEKNALYRALVSVSDLETSFLQCLDSGVRCFVGYYPNSRTLDTHCTDDDKMAYLSKVRLIISYA